MASKQETAPVVRRRLALGPSRRRLRYEHRIRLWLTVLGAPMVLLAVWLAYLRGGSVAGALGVGLGAMILWGILSASFYERLVRPLQTLTNVVAALRDDDFTLRARGATRGDSLGDLAFEVNALAGLLQAQRSAARDALTLVERVMTSMQAPVLAFDGDGRLVMLNEAACGPFGLQSQASLGRSAGELGLETLLTTRDQDVYAGAAESAPDAGPVIRWSVRRTTFRLHGIPHTLLVLADVAGALREEERVAWQRLIRVLSHEINNSLTPIMSIAGSLRGRIPVSAIRAPQDTEDLRRGLGVIEECAASLARFLLAYQKLNRLPPPQLQAVSLQQLVERVADLEIRLAVEVRPGLPVTLDADPDQLQQLLINLIRNAAEAALAASKTAARVTVAWSVSPDFAAIQVRDNGLGLIDPANLFVPFYTTKAEGSGIGLVLAQQIATAHKGSISLYNNPHDAGCTAELYLPIRRLR